MSSIASFRRGQLASVGVVSAEPGRILWRPAESSTLARRGELASATADREPALPQAPPDRTLRWFALSLALALGAALVGTVFMSGSPPLPSAHRVDTVALPPSSSGADLAVEIGLTSVAPGGAALLRLHLVNPASCGGFVDYGSPSTTTALPERPASSDFLWTWQVPTDIPQHGGEVYLACTGDEVRIPFGIAAPPIGTLLLVADKTSTDP